MTRVVVAGLKKSFGDKVVLDKLDLEVAEGSLTAVLGPSGSGKTTLLRILAGFERPDEGQVSLGGVVVEDGHTHLPPESRRVGYVPQDGALFPHLNAAGNVGFGLSRNERKSGRVDELLELVGLAGEGGRYPHQLSGGMQQRVALARALAAKPSLVLLDEPFASLDASLRAEVRADVARVLSDTGTTSVLVTHDQDEALSLADRVAVLRGGRVAQCAGPEEIYADPLDPALARFVGDANVVRGTVRGGMAVTALGPLLIADGGAPVRESEEVLVLVRPEQVTLHASVGAANGARGNGNGGNGGNGSGGNGSGGNGSGGNGSGGNGSGGTGGTSGAGGSTVTGRVAKCHYYGHDMLVTVEMDGEKEGTRSLLSARLTGRSPLSAGSAVEVSVGGPVKVWRA